jgi:serine/threonine protein kinase
MPVDARTDVFSTGIILHEMLTTEKLFRGDTEFALMEKVRKAEVSPPSKFNRRVPETLDRIVLKALARDLPDRYQTAVELADELNQFIAQYRFQPSEMQEFVRTLFRGDYQKEAEEIDACRQATLDREPEAMIIESSPAAPVPPAPRDNRDPRESRDPRDPREGRAAFDPTQPIQTPDSMPSLPSAIQSPPAPPNVAMDDPTAEQKKVAPSSGLWSRLRERFTK